MGVETRPYKKRRKEKQMASKLGKELGNSLAQGLKKAQTVAPPKPVAPPVQFAQTSFESPVPIVNTPQYQQTQYKPPEKTKEELIRNITQNQVAYEAPVPPMNVQVPSLTEKLSKPTGNIVQDALNPVYGANIANFEVARNAGGYTPAQSAGPTLGNYLDAWGVRRERLVNERIDDYSNAVPVGYGGTVDARELAQNMMNPPEDTFISPMWQEITKPREEVPLEAYRNMVTVPGVGAFDAVELAQNIEEANLRRQERGEYNRNNARPEDIITALGDDFTYPGAHRPTYEGYILSNIYYGILDGTADTVNFFFNRV